MTGLNAKSSSWKIALVGAAAFAAYQFASGAEGSTVAMRLGVHPDARAALALHCDALADRERGECRSFLREEFARDEEHAQAIIRLHCTRYATVWEGDPSSPAPAPCAERFGGWLRG